ncbi:hypothetical protein [Streptomyces sp. NPDC015350]|uniref:hypothetical protein n=1 Tax=Streptomyces sp. NPDC015350 TaxID=3364955 RepID=UPI0036FB3679
MTNSPDCDDLDYTDPNTAPEGGPYHLAHLMCDPRYVNNTSGRMELTVFPAVLEPESDFTDDPTADTVLETELDLAADAADTARARAAADALLRAEGWYPAGDWECADGIDHTLLVCRTEAIYDSTPDLPPLPPLPRLDIPAPLPARQSWFEGQVLITLLSPQGLKHHRKGAYDSLTRAQILAGLWNNAAPWRGAPPARTEPMTVQEAEAVLADRPVDGHAERAHVSVKELAGRTLHLQFYEGGWKTRGYDLYQGQEGLLDRVLVQLRETGAVDQLPES